MKRRHLKPTPTLSDPYNTEINNDAEYAISSPASYDHSKNKEKMGHTVKFRPSLIAIKFLSLITFITILLLKLHEILEISHLYNLGERHDVWDSPIIHIINTRFMQNQANLKTLATARLYLFKTVCLPSMLNQSTNDFIWIIKVDPGLDKDIRNELIQSIRQQMHRMNINENNDSGSMSGRIFVVGSNYNFNYGEWRGGMESKEVLSHETKNQIYMGDVNFLKSARNVEVHKIVLETRLDADDGLDKGYVEYLHENAMNKFLAGNPLGVERGKEIRGRDGDAVEEKDIDRHFKWLYWCIESHFKWYVNGDGEFGQLGGERRRDFCITPGLTVGYNVGTQVKDVPMFGHQDLLWKLRGNRNCIERDLGSKVLKDADLNGTSKAASNDLIQRVPCIEIVSGFTAAMRSRSATSAGMNDVKGKESKEGPDRPQLWVLLEDRFGMTVTNAIETKNYFDLNMKQIAKENLEGQCQLGHSCKESSKEKLRKIVDGTHST